MDTLTESPSPEHMNPEVVTPETAAPASVPPKTKTSAKTNLFATLFAFIALAALGLAGWQWYETRERMAEMQQELSERFPEIEPSGKEPNALSKQVHEEQLALQAQIAGYENRLTGLENRLTGLANQQTALEAFFRDRKPDPNALLADIERSVVFAAYRLQLTGNVQGAILALQSAEGRITDDARFLVLRKALSRDLDRLRAVPQTDLAGINMRLESVISMLDTLPFAIDARPVRRVPPEESDKGSAPADLSFTSLEFWKNLGARAWKSVRGRIRIERIDRQEAALLFAPDQKFFLRENCKLRLLGARIALLSSNQTQFRHDIEQARGWIERYFDLNEKSVQTVLETLRQFGSFEIGAKLPDFDESLSALATLKSGKENE